MASTADGASSSTSSSTSIPRWSYQVFLSFRGEDTRRGFTDHLYASLQRRGIITFRDDPELERGELISVGLLKAIEESMFAVIVLSPNYASSTWCLDELHKILECRKNLGQGVFPIFYGVDPSDVRHQRGLFAESFRKHENRFREDKDKVQKWRDSLVEIASISGWDFKDQHEAGFIKSIVEDIQKKLIPKLPSGIDNLVGIGSKVDKVNMLLGVGLSDVRFIGIWGIGGIGKTTIARLVYEGIPHDQFKDTCFLANVREASERNGLVDVQRQLLSQLNAKTNGIYDLYEGRNAIRNRLYNKMVLLVLDDVNDLSQLENLVGKQDWFGPGSRVIVTTRDMHLLIAHGTYKICEVQGLNHAEALQLFCLRAFKRNQPEEGYLNLSEQIVEYAGGLPLALQVLGSDLCGRTVDTWHSALKKMKSFPNPEILHILKISYDGLPEMERNIFLDIACFFNGTEKDQVTEILENCGHCPKIGIEILIERSLLTLDPSDNKLRMHDLLQEMGRYIVFQESPNDPGRRSRLWSQEDIDHVLRKNKGTEAIQGIVLDLPQKHEACWNPEAFSKTSQIKLLKLCYMKLPLGLNCLPSELKILEWRRCPLKTLPLAIELDELVDLKLCYSEIVQLWNGAEYLENLRFIDLSFSKNLKKSPDISRLQHLERLVLEGCTSLIEVHPSLGLHRGLVVVNLKDCSRLETLPVKLEMTSMEELVISGCFKVKKLPEFDECMIHLSMLSVQETSINELPSSLGCLVGLAVLDLKDCKSLFCLPSTICSLKYLRILNVSGCAKLSTLPDALKEIKSLSELDASGTAMVEIPPSVFYLENLKVLSFTGCKGPASKSGSFLPFGWNFGSQPMSSLSSLQTLNLSYCNLSAVPYDVYHLSALRRLDLSGNNFVSLPSSISKFPKLMFLYLACCKRLQLLPEFPSSLELLDASNCAVLEASKFDPSKPCNLLASTKRVLIKGDSIQAMIINEFKEAFCCLNPVFDMFIPGDEIPSWFDHQNSRFFVSVQLPHNYPPMEWVGFALCFVLVNCTYQPESKHEFYCYIEEVEEDQKYSRAAVPISHRNVPHMEPFHPHLYILYLSGDQYHSRWRDGKFTEIEFSLKPEDRYGGLEVMKSGCRLICQKNVQDWNKAVAKANNKSSMAKKYSKMPIHDLVNEFIRNVPNKLLRQQILEL